MYWVPSVFFHQKQVIENKKWDVSNTPDEASILLEGDVVEKFHITTEDNKVKTNLCLSKIILKCRELDICLTL